MVQKLKIGIKINSRLRNSIAVVTFSVLLPCPILTFFVWDWKYRFSADLIQKSKLFVSAEICYLHYFEDAESNGHVQVLFIRPVTHFLRKFHPKILNEIWWNSYLTSGPNQIYTEFDGQAQFFYCRAEISCLIELGPKIQSWLFSI